MMFHMVLLFGYIGGGNMAVRYKITKMEAISRWVETYFQYLNVVYPLRSQIVDAINFIKHETIEEIVFDQREMQFELDSPY